MITDPNGFLPLVLRGGGMGAGLGTTFLVFKLLFGRLDKKEAHVDAATKSLIEELKDEIGRLRADCAELRTECGELRQKWIECEERHAETHAELLGVKRLLQASGEIRNRIQSGVAAEKLLGGGSKK